MAIFYIDLVSGNDSNDGSSWANAWKTISNGATAARIAPGDTIRISKTADPISIGNATWTDLSKTVTLAAARTITVDRCETAWTAVNSATVTRQGVATDAKEGSYCMQVTAPASPFTNTLYAYYAISPTDFSSKQELTFWIKNEVAIAAGNWKICLCSDNAGATPVDTFEIIAIPSTGRWLPLTIARTGGGNLGNAIQSIALYSSSVAPTASKYLRLDNFEASATDDLNLQTLISKNGAAQGGTEGYYGIQSIVGTTVLLDNETNTLANAGRGYSGTTETVNTYIRKTFKTALASSSNSAIHNIQDSGTHGNNIQFQGGYDTSSGSQSGETFFDGLNGYGYGLQISSRNYIAINYFANFRYYYGIYINSSSNCIIDNLSNANNNSYGININYSDNNVLNNLSNANSNLSYGLYINNSKNNVINYISNANNNLSSGVLFNTNSNNNIINDISNINNNIGAGLYISNSYGNIIDTISSAKNNLSFGIYIINGSGNNMIKSLYTIGNTAGAIYNQNNNYIRNASIAETSEVTSILYDIGILWSKKHDTTEGNDWGYTYQGTINYQTGIKHDTEPGSWKVAVLGSTRNSQYKIVIPAGEYAATKSENTTIKAWVKKDHATNVAARLVVYADTALGITEASDTKADDTDWEELSITVQATNNTYPVIQAFLEVWYVAGTSNVYLGSVSQT